MAKGQDEGFRPPNSVPEPTINGSGRDAYYWPHSKTPEKDALYAFLRQLGWRFHQRTATFHTPEHWTQQSYGYLAHTPELTRAWIKPPNRPDGPKHTDGLHIGAPPILHLIRVYDEWSIDDTGTHAAAMERLKE